MNIRQFVPRKDCKAFAKCGFKSLSRCRRYRGEDKTCKGILLFIVNFVMVCITLLRKMRMKTGDKYLRIDC